MSELKAFSFKGILGDTNDVYSKYEVDIVIDEKDKEIAKLKKERDWLAKDRALACDDLEKRAQLNIKKDKEIAKLKDKLPRLISVGERFPSADDGHFFALWEDGLPDIGYIGAEDDVIETIRDRGEGHSIEWWMPLPEKPEVK